MHCKNHIEREATAACVYCGSLFCNDCLIEIHGKKYCKDHVSNLIDEVISSRTNNNSTYASDNNIIKSEEKEAVDTGNIKNKRKSSKKIITILISSIILIIVIAIASSNKNTNINSTIDLVKNGHLGNYKTVTLSKMLETNFKSLKWDSFESSEYQNIVEVTVEEPDNNLKIQFSVNDDETFKVVYLASSNRNPSTPYERKVFLDVLYQSYADISSDASVVADTDTSNNTLTGSK